MIHWSCCASSRRVAREPGEQVSGIALDDSSGSQGRITITNCQAEPERTNTMNRIARISIGQMYFSTVPDRRVAEITAALDAQRANRRTAPAGSIDADTAARNVVDLEGVLERAEVNLQAHTAHLARLDAARKAEADAADQRKLNDVTEKLRTAYMMQPGASESEFTRVLPDLLLEQRRQAALGASAEFDRQLAEQRRRIGAF